ncbi:Scr1 family TA system antitoxin-like transcriptional regulator [Kitasatospora misakiensis]|uniref:Scr1 family TA system antitoxin-like transcriptional regulator n=1 Tax=Kitasatospora misakiensis TaxID=67330 RepID=A0ABW0X5R0_9ACTN
MRFDRHCCSPPKRDGGVAVDHVGTHQSLTAPPVRSFGRLSVALTPHHSPTASRVRASWRPTRSPWRPVRSRCGRSSTRCRPPGGDRSVVGYTESAEHGYVVRMDGTVREWERAYDRLQADALTRAASLELIRKARKELLP